MRADDVVLTFGAQACWAGPYFDAAVLDQVVWCFLMHVGVDLIDQMDRLNEDLRMAPEALKGPGALT